MPGSLVKTFATRVDFIIRDSSGFPVAKIRNKYILELPKFTFIQNDAAIRNWLKHIKADRTRVHSIPFEISYECYNKFFVLFSIVIEKRGPHLGAIVCVT